MCRHAGRACAGRPPRPVRARGRRPGSRRDAAGQPAGSMGDAAGFSFYPSKNLGALGDGGAVTVRPRIGRACPQAAQPGPAAKGEHLEAGFNERLDGLQAAFLRVKLGATARGQRRPPARRARYRSSCRGRLRRWRSVRARTACTTSSRFASLSATSSGAARHRGCRPGSTTRPPCTTSSHSRAPADHLVAECRGMGGRRTVAADVPAHNRRRGRAVVVALAESQEEAI